MVDQQALRAFVADAHRNGYATTDAAETDDFGATCIEYADDEYHYVDRYVGSRTFVGFEVVSYERQPVWAMAYSGAPTEPSVAHADVYPFLREALEAVSPENPYRGPDSFDGERFTYRADTDGTIARFTGVEKVECDGTVIYRGEYGGGRLD